MSTSLRGHFLIANKHLKDTNFFKTVVLLVEHGADGAMGVVVNRPSSVKVAHALSDHFELPDDDNVVYLGGPVEPGALFILHNAPELDVQEKPVVPGLFVASSADVFESVVRAAASGQVGLSFRVFCGCAGWAPGQLEGELARGDWYLHRADACSLFHVDPYDLWDRQVASVNEANRILPKSPSRPEWN
jgi:putative transcriptional regulator